MQRQVILYYFEIKIKIHRKNKDFLQIHIMIMLQLYYSMNKNQFYFKHLKTKVLEFCLGNNLCNIKFICQCKGIYLY